MNPEFLALLIEGRERHGGSTPGAVQRFAKVLRLTRQRTSDALGGKRGPLDVERCLRLAIDGGHNPYDVLRKAGHNHEAELLEAMFGPWLPAAADRRALRGVAERLANRPETTADESSPTPPEPSRPNPRRRRH
jgi:hypothetical protein